MEADEADVNVLQRGDASPIQRDRSIPIRTFELVLGKQVSVGSRRSALQRFGGVGRESSHLISPSHFTIMSNDVPSSLKFASCKRRWIAPTRKRNVSY